MAIVRKFQNSFTSGVLSPGVQARTDLARYAAGCKRIVNGVIHAHGGISNRPGTSFVDELPGDGILIPFTYSVEQAYVLCFFGASGEEKAKMRVYKTGSVVLGDDGNIYEIETPFLRNDMPRVKFAQSADVLFMVHPQYAPLKLTRNAHNSWAFETMSFAPSIPAPTGLSAKAENFKDSSNTYVATTTQYKVAAVDERENESVPSAAVTADTLSTWPSGARVTLTWEGVAGAVRYEVYKDERGYFAWIGSADSTSFVDNNIEGDAGTGPKENRDPFAGENDKPGAVGIYQQRLVFGRSNNAPQTVWLSETGAFDSMAVAQPLRDDSAITAQIDSKQMNEIRHFIPLRDMLVLSSGAELKMGAAGNSGAITPTTISFDIQSYWGSSEVPPLVIGTSILMVENSGRVVRDLHFSYTEDGYTGDDVSILAEHLIDSPVRDWAYQQSPFSAVWIVLESGKLLTLTYMREQEISAWSEHESSGARFRSVSVIREKFGGSEVTEDSAYFIVQRDGKYFVEAQVRRHYGDDIKQSFFVDCGAQYNDPANPIIKVSGLKHLAGKDIAVLADGSVYHTRVDADGGFELPEAAGVISAGLPYSMTVETLDPEIRADNGSTLGDRKNVARAVFFLRETRGITVGPDEAHLMPLKLPMPKKWGDPPPLFTGEISAALPGVHREGASLVFKQDDPLPATVLAVASWVNVN